MVTLLLVLLLAADWTSVADKLSKSVVYMESVSGSCTGFVIDANAKGDKDRILTAAHCDGKELFADNAIARVIWKDTKADLMVVEVEDTGRPAVTFAAKNPEQGQEVVSFGFGMGLERPMFRHAYVSNASISLPDIEGGPFVMIDAAYVPGQSGGPVINAAGEVSAIVQRASGLVGIGVGAEKIRDKIGRYLQRVP